MTYEELQAEALRQGYKLVAIEPKPLLMQEAFPNNGMRWTEEGIDALHIEFFYGASIFTISDSHGRTPQAIASRLLSLKLITNRAGTQDYYNLKGKHIASKKSMEAFVRNRTKT